MSEILLGTILIFVFYYLACFDVFKSNYKLVFVIFFITSSLFLRFSINPNINNDYYLYFNFKIFHKPKDFLSIFIGEPYLYVVYSFFKLFSNDKEVVFQSMYWFNFIFSTIFFVWLVTRKDVQMWKKMFLFSCYYFFFAFVLLRNGPVYMIFGYYFYYTFRAKKFNLVLLTPFMHISSSLMVLTYFYKSKYYYYFMVGSCIIMPISLYLMMPFLSRVPAFDTIIAKVHIYSRGMAVVGILHKLFFLFITTLVIVGSLVYKKEMLNPIIITALVLYYISFFINPIVAFRFSPYVLLSLFLFDFEELKNKKIIKFLNFSTILLFPYFLYALYHTHYL